MNKQTIGAELNRIALEMRELGQRGEWSAEDSGKFERLNRRADQLEAQLRATEITGELSRVPEPLVAKRVAWNQDHTRPSDISGVTSTEDYRTDFDSFIRRGVRTSTLEQGFQLEFRAGQLVGTDNVGGYSVPDALMPVLEESALAYGGVYSAPVQRLRTSNGRTIPWPTDNDTTNVAAILAEAGEETSTTDVPFGIVNVGAYKFSTKFIKCSLEFIQDTSIDSSAWVARKFGTRYGRGIADYLITGDGTGEPQGLDAGGLGVTFAGAAAITRDDILDLMHSLDPAYRNLPSTRLILNDTSVKAIRKLTVGSSDDRPLWTAGDLSRGIPPQIEGMQYVIDQSVADIGAGNHSMYVAALEKFIVREVNPPILLRLTERFAEFGQVGFIGFYRMDSRILDAGTDPIVYGRHPAS